MDTRPEDADLEHVVVRAESPYIAKSRRFALRRGVTRSPKRQQLSFGDLLLWLTFVSVYFGIVRIQKPEAQVGVTGLALLLPQALVAGTSWTGLWLLTVRLLRRISPPLLPGHWLLVVLGFRLTVEVLMGFSLRNFFASSQAVLSAVMCCALVLPTLSQRLPAVWKVVFGVLVIVHGIPLLGVLLSIWFESMAFPGLSMASIAAKVRLLLSPCLPLLVSVYLASRDERYSVMHWVGVVTWITWHILQPALLERFV